MPTAPTRQHALDRSCRSGILAALNDVDLFVSRIGILLDDLSEVHNIYLITNGSERIEKHLVRITMPERFSPVRKFRSDR